MSKLNSNMIDSSNQIEVRYVDDMKNFVIVIGAQTKDQAVTAADNFLEEYDQCVKGGGCLYGDESKANEFEFFNVG